MCVLCEENSGKYQKCFYCGRSICLDIKPENCPGPEDESDGPVTGVKIDENNICIYCNAMLDYEGDIYEAMEFDDIPF